MSFCGVEENKYADIKHQMNQEYPPLPKKNLLFEKIMTQTVEE